jgi:hypothetical protein
MKTVRPIVPLPDFQCISNAAAGIILSESGRLIGKCVLFGIMGEWLLRRKYKISDARAVVGAFGICVSQSKVIAFAGHQGTSNNHENFHCWVEAAGFIFDFSSFLYPELAGHLPDFKYQPLMFQKRASQVSNSINSLQKPGDFYFLEDRSLKEITIDATLAVPAVADLLEILVNWYEPPPKKMSVIEVTNGKGHTKSVSIHNAVLLGAW